MYIMNNKVKKSIERIVNLPIEKIRTLSIGDEREIVKKRSSKDLHFSKHQRGSIYGRGNPLLAKKKYRTMEDVNNKLDKMLDDKF
ncbi:MAG: hypothetical protein R3Y33_07730 [Clostridia bacterium]